MNSAEAQAHLEQALAGLTAADPSLPDDAVLQDWYLITTHTSPEGRVFSRYTRQDQPDHVDMGLLEMAKTLDRQELLADE
jgi:hypothetical protein